MKKQLSLIAAALATSFLLASCAGSAASGTSSAAGSSSGSASSDSASSASVSSSGSASSASAPDTTKAGPDGRTFIDGKLNKSYTLKLVKPTQFNEAIFADYEGFFKAVGLDVQYIGALPENISLAQAVATGMVDVFGSGHVTNIVNAREAGVNLKIVNAATLDSPDFNKTHMTWFVRADSKIKSPADLKGKTIATTSLGGCAELWNTVLLHQNNLNASDVHLTVISSELSIEQALRQGQIDVGILHGPNNVIAYSKGGLRILAKSYDIAKKAGGDGSLSAVGVRAFTEDFIKEHPAVVKAYVTAENRAQEWANANYDKALADAAKFLNVDPKLIAGNYYTKAQWVEGNKIQFWVKTAEDNKLAGFEKPVDYTDLFTNEYNPFYLKELKS